MKPSFIKTGRIRTRVRIACYVAAMLLLGLAAGYSGRQSPRVVWGQEPALEEPYTCEEWTIDGWSTPREGPPRGYVFFHKGPTDEEPRHLYEVLKEGYGMMIYCYSPERLCFDARFKLFAHDRGMLADTTDMAQLKRAISQIPAGETILLINTCGGGTHFGLDPAVLDEIADFCQRRGVKFMYAEGVICGCA